MSDPVFRLTMLPAGPGDALWIEYGHEDDLHYVLVDGGVPETMPELTARIEQMPPPKRLELVVVTHIDDDHLGAIVELFAASSTDVDVRDVWFNGWKHLPGANEDDRLGAEQAEFFSLVVGARGIPWNHAFGEGPIMVDETGPLPPRTLEGGLKLTVLSPGEKELKKLKAKWAKSLEKHGLGGTDWSVQKFLDYMHSKRRNRDDILGGEVPDIEAEAAVPFSPDSSPTNGSGIALLAEFAGRACLLSGDAFAPRVRASIERLRKERLPESLVIDTVKLAHHGSAHNTSVVLIKSLGCRRFLVSTDGSGQQRHPDPAAIARIVTTATHPDLYFNYRSGRTEMWENHPDQATYGFRTNYPETTNGTRTVDLLA